MYTHNINLLNKIYKNLTTILLDQFFGPQPRFMEPDFAPYMIPYLHPQRIPVMVYQSIFSMHPLVSNLRTVVHEAKFFKNPYALTFCARSYIQAITWLAAVTQSNTVYLIPLPMSKRRLLQKGYNQCDILIDQIIALQKEQSNSLHKQTKLSLKKLPLLTKPKHTPQQARLNRKARAQAQRNTYTLDKHNLAVHTHHTHHLKNSDLYVIIDDITTTGATLRDALGALGKGLLQSRQNNDSFIYCALTFAYTPQGKK